MFRTPDNLPATDYLVIQHPQDSLTNASAVSTPTGSTPSVGTHSSKNVKLFTFLYNSLKEKEKVIIIKKRSIKSNIQIFNSV